MQSFADWYGDWSTTRNASRWQSLGDACITLALTARVAHRATGDALATLGVMQALAAHTEADDVPEERPSRFYFE